MAQASILGYAALYPETAAKKPMYYLGKVEARFSKPVTVGDRLIVEVQKEKILKGAGIVSALAKVNDQIAAEAKIAFGVILKTTDDRR
jgi:3-hydroxyacyl-[acyl-carrier-protein] dehydratase